jgi:hypothetical protein
MTYFPQAHPLRRAARIRLGSSVLAVIRLENGRRTKARLECISVTGGLLRTDPPLRRGCFIELAFQTPAGPVHGMAEILAAAQPMTGSAFQPFRFVAIEEDDHRRLRLSVDQTQGKASLPQASLSQASLSQARLLLVSWT